MKNKVITSLLALHLLVIFLGTGMVDFSKIPVALQPAISFYLAITGGHPYNFFSPDIPTQIVVKCYIIDSNGQTYTETFDRKTNSFQLRTNYLFQLLDNTNEPEAAARIAADYCFKQHSTAKSVSVSIGRFMVPSIPEYKQGKQCGFSELYTQTFTHE